MRRLLIISSIVASIALAGAAEATALDTGSNIAVNTTTSELTADQQAKSLLDGTLTILSASLAAGLSLIIKKKVRLPHSSRWNSVLT